MPGHEGESAELGAHADASNFLPSDESYFGYDGSLTTPPCSEGAKWHVLTHAIEASAHQIESFASLHPGSYRPVRPWNSRSFETGDGHDR